MSWQNVFRRDLRSTFRSRLGPAAVLVLLLSTVGVAGLVVFTADPRYPPDMEGMVVVFGSIQSFLLPLVALMATYSAVVSERTTGSIRFLLGLPNSRADAYVGKFCSRALVVVAPTVVGLLVAGAILTPVVQNGSFVFFAQLAALSTVYALLFLGVGLTASVVADTDTRAVAYVVGAFALLRAGWPAAQWAGLQSLETPVPKPGWYFWVGRANPMNAYVKLTTELYPVDSHPLITTPRTLPDNGGRFGYTVDFARESAAGTFPVSGEFAAVALVALALVAPVAGFLHFRRRDVL